MSDNRGDAPHIRRQVRISKRWFNCAGPRKLAGIIPALLSAVILLWTHFLVDLSPKLLDYGDPKKEFDSCVTQVVMRAKWIAITGFLSFLSLVPLLVIVILLLALDGIR